MEIAVALIALAIILIVVARRLGARAPLPAGRVLYSDTGAWRRNDRALFSKRHLLSGKPDYLIDAPDGVVPVELKSGRAPARPRDGHVLQLAAYCLLVEEQMNTTVHEGVIQYADRQFVIAYDDALRERLLAALDDMRACLDDGDAARSHQDARRCASCGVREACDQVIS